MSIPDQHPLLAKLSGGDRRSIGRSNEVVAAVLADPTLFTPLYRGLHHTDTLIRIRTADALEKITSRRPEWLEPHVEDLLLNIAASVNHEVRWHVAQMLPRLPLTRTQRAFALKIVKGYLDDRSSIVRAFALQALADFAEHEAGLRDGVITLLREALHSGTPAMRSRARKLLEKFGVAERLSPRGSSRPKRPRSRRR
jgi:HEAT repeat protein